VPLRPVLATAQLVPDHKGLGSEMADLPGGGVAEGGEFVLEFFHAGDCLGGGVVGLARWARPGADGRRDHQPHPSRLGRGHAHGSGDHPGAREPPPEAGKSGAC